MGSQLRVGVLGGGLQGCSAALWFSEADLLPLLLLLTAFFVIEFAYPRFPVMDEITYRRPAGTQAEESACRCPRARRVSAFRSPVRASSTATTRRSICGCSASGRALIGFGWATCVGYDALISAGLAIIMYDLGLLWEVRCPAPYLCISV